MLSILNKKICHIKISLQNMPLFMQSRAAVKTTNLILMLGTELSQFEKQCGIYFALYLIFHMRGSSAPVTAD